MFLSIVGFVISPNYHRNTQIQRDTKEYKNSTYGFSFRYPKNWYYEKTAEAPDDNGISFFLVGTKAAHSYGDYAGNEVLMVEASMDDRGLDELIKTHYPNGAGKIMTINGKPALKTIYNDYIIKLDSTRMLSVRAVREGVNHLEEIISTAQFN